MSEEEVKEPEAGGILEDVNIEEEMLRDYIDYSMSVIVGRGDDGHRIFSDSPQVHF